MRRGKVDRAKRRDRVMLATALKGSPGPVGTAYSDCAGHCAVESGEVGDTDPVQREAPVVTAGEWALGNYISTENVMATKLRLRALVFVACTALAALTGSVGAAEVPVITGEQWTKSSEDLKKAYLVGIANLIQVETAYFGTNPPPDTQSFVPRFVKGLQGETLDSVREALNRWYANNPGKLQRPVLETIWFEIVVPGLAKSK